MSAAAQYLLALYVLSDRQSPPIQTSDVAELLDRSLPSVTEMFQRLEDDGLVVYEPYQGVSLTETGRERAGSLHETYVTVARFFQDVLDLDSSESNAIELAAVLDPSAAEVLASELADETDGPIEVETERRTTSRDDHL